MGNTSASPKPNPSRHSTDSPRSANIDCTEVESQIVDLRELELNAPWIQIQKAQTQNKASLSKVPTKKNIVKKTKQYKENDIDSLGDVQEIETQNFNLDREIENKENKCGRRLVIQSREGSVLEHGKTKKCRVSRML